LDFLSHYPIPDSAQLGIDLRFVVAVAARTNNARALAHETTTRIDHSTI